METIVGIAVITIVAGLVVEAYFLPFLIADSRKAKAAASIFVLNLFLGWTALFWFVALVWAMAGERRPGNER